MLRFGCLGFDLYFDCSAVCVGVGYSFLRVTYFRLAN